MYFPEIYIFNFILLEELLDLSRCKKKLNIIYEYI